MYALFDVELRFFERNRKEWCKHHLGKFALILGTTVHDFYDTHTRAYEVGCQTWGLAPFFIKEVQLEDKVIFIPDRVVINEYPVIKEPT